MKQQILLFIILLGFSFDAKTQQINLDQSIVKILTFNILHGANTSGDFDLDKIALVIKKTDPDLVALQEVDFKTNRAKKYDLATELGWRTKMAPLFGQAMRFDGGGYGEGILTKMPIISSRNVTLPHSHGNEPRCALEVLVRIESGDTISFIATHLEHQKDSKDRIAQVEKLNAVFKDSDYPAILAGDLNATPESEPIEILKKYWTDSSGENATPTYPSNNPRVKIDYIFFQPNERWQVLDSQVICDEVASDHCAVLSVLKLKN
jgi:endonuclease/exonuclease/phosphatase family metal-dependent hydrolase